jgi:hypothetical protein
MSAPYRISRPPAAARDVAVAGGSQDFKFYLDRLMKMIPGEVVGLYLVGSGFIPVGDNLVLGLWAFICFLGVVALKAFGTADPTSRTPPDWLHVVISAVAFVLWVYTMGGPFTATAFHVPYVGSLLVLAWTFFVPIFYRGPLD